MNRKSTFRKLGLPEPFGVIVLTVALILFLSPYLSGANLGIFNIPDLGASRTTLLVLGPVLLVASIALFIPVWPPDARGDDASILVNAVTPGAAVTGIQVVTDDARAKDAILTLASGREHRAFRAIIISSGLGPHRHDLIAKLVEGGVRVRLFYQDPATAPDGTDASDIPRRLAHIRDYLPKGTGEDAFSARPVALPSSLRCVLLYDKSGDAYAAQIGWYTYAKDRQPNSQSRSDVRVYGSRNPSLLVTQDGSDGRPILAFAAQTARELEAAFG